MRQEYYTEFNATLEAHGFEKLAEDTIDALSKEATYYESFISTCMQQGMTKSAAAALYKEAGLVGGALKTLNTGAKIIDNIKNISKVKETGKGLWTAIRHPFITDKALKGSAEAIQSATTRADRLKLLRVGSTVPTSPLYNLAKNRAAAIAEGGRALKEEQLLHTMMANRIRATPTEAEFLKRTGITTRAPGRVRKVTRARKGAPSADTAPTSNASTASTASTPPVGAPQGTAEIKATAANPTTDAASLGATGAQANAATIAGIKEKLTGWGKGLLPYAFVGGAGYLLGDHGAGSPPITVAPTIMVPGAGGPGGAYIPGATQNGLMYGYG